MTYNPQLPIIWLIVIFIAAILVTSIIIFSSKKLKRGWLRILVLLLRISVIAILFYVLLNPVRIKKSQGRNEVLKDVLLVDASSSMNIESPTSRMKQLQAILSTVKTESQQKLICYKFDTVAIQVDTFASVFSIDAKGNTTNLASAIQQVINQEEGKSIRNIIVCSDGQMNDKAKLEQSISLARKNEIPVSVLGIGQDTELFNVEIKECNTELHALPNARVPVKVFVESKGSRNEYFELNLKNSKNEIVDQKSGQLKDGITEFDLELNTGLDTEKYKVELSSIQGELTAVDNSFEFEIKVSDPKIRVLYIEGTNVSYNKRIDNTGGRWPAYRFINDALEKTGRIEVEPYVVDQQKNVGGEIYHAETNKKGYPKTKEEIFTYDVIICSDINKFIFNEDQLQWTREMVEENGGGFCMIGGHTSFGAGGYDKTIWEQMIPVDMETFGNAFVERRVTPSFPAKNISHPILRFHEDDEKNLAIIKTHPSFNGTNIVNRAKPAATVLAFWKDRNNMPLICVQPYGKGRTMAFTSDAAGGWGEGYQNGWGEPYGNNNYYQKFWVNAVMWLAENSRANKQEKLLFNTDKLSYNTGEQIQLEAEVSGTEEEYVVETFFAKSDSKHKIMEFNKALKVYSGSQQVPDGYNKDKFILVCNALKKNGDVFATDTIALPVKQMNPEYQNPNPDYQSLEKLLTLTGGTNIKSGDDINTLLDGSKKQKSETEEPQKIPIWDKWWLWLAILLLMSGEWLIRKFGLTK